MKRMSRIMVVTVLMAAFGFSVAGSAAQAEKIKIVATTADLASLAQAVGGELVEVHNICTGKEDPHFLTAKPSFIMQARDADLWIRVGMELEVGWEPPVLDGSRNARIREGAPGHLDASEKVIKLEIPTVRISREMGDVHPSGNPHYWLDPYNGRIVAESICDRLCNLFPAHSDQFKANLGSFKKKLDEHMFGAEVVTAVGGDQAWRLFVDGALEKHLESTAKNVKAGGWVAAMKPLRGHKMVTYHTSWIYFASRFGLEIAAELEPKPGIPPSAAHLTRVAELAQKQNVKLIVQEPFYNRKAADRIAGKTGARVVVVANSVGGQKEATDYVALLDLIVKMLAEK